VNNYEISDFVGHKIGTEKRVARNEWLKDLLIINDFVTLWPLLSHNLLQQNYILWRKKYRSRNRNPFKLIFLLKFCKVFVQSC